MNEHDYRPRVIDKLVDEYLSAFGAMCIEGPKWCGENDRVAYGKQLLQLLPERLTAEFGKGFDVSNLRNMRRFYAAFPIQDALQVFDESN